MTVTVQSRYTLSVPNVHGRIQTDLFSVDENTAGCLIYSLDETGQEPYIACFEPDTGQIRSTHPITSAGRIMGARSHGGAFFLLEQRGSDYYLLRSGLQFATLPIKSEGVDGAIWQFEVCNSGIICVSPRRHNDGAIVSCSRTGELNWELSIGELFPNEYDPMWEHWLLKQPDGTFVLFAGCDYFGDDLAYSYFYTFIHFNEAGDVLFKHRIFQETMGGEFRVGANEGVGLYVCGKPTYLWTAYGQESHRFATAFKTVGDGNPPETPTFVLYQDHAYNEHLKFSGAAFVGDRVVIGCEGLGLVVLKCG